MARKHTAGAARGGGYEPIETASRDELAALQLERLRWSLGHAYQHVAHYRDAFAAAGVHPEELRALSDLGRFPFLVKEDLRRHYPFGMFAVPRTSVARIHASSGTTGKPTVVGYTARDIDTWANLMARSLYAAGARAGQIVHVAYGYGLFTGGLGAHYGAERLGCTVVPMSGGQTEKQVQLIQDFRPDVILVTPSYMLTITEEFMRRGIDPRSTSLEIGIFGAEPWSEQARAEIERRLDLEAIDIYGLSEVMGPGVACECIEDKSGPVVWEDHFYPEIVDPDSGRVLADGEEGELVLTSLTKEAFPVIRYRTRDRTRLLPSSARTMRRLARIAGRTDDMLIIRGVNLFPSQVEELVLQQPALAPYYLLEVDREQHLDVLTVAVEWGGAGPGTHEERARAALELTHRIRSSLGLGVRVAVKDPGSLERSVGKARRVVDRRAARPP